ncbi:hypothetical protein R4B61_02920 [Fructilactobacillus vespulae]|uniref:hypothetical protein n=1 Tax=Fructilactobacillus vespulae TaxID=1249630 RepID=UPI0039B3DFC9
MEQIEKKLLKLRKFANFVITPLFAIMLLSYYVQGGMTVLVTSLVVLCLAVYIPYMGIVLYYVMKRRKLNKQDKS